MFSERPTCLPSSTELSAFMDLLKVENAGAGHWTCAAPVWDETMAPVRVLDLRTRWLQLGLPDSEFEAKVWRMCEQRWLVPDYRSTHGWPACDEHLFLYPGRAAMLA